MCEEGLTTKGRERTFWSEGNILHFDCGGSYPTACISPNSQNLALKVINYSACKLLFNRKKIFFYSPGFGIRLHLNLVPQHFSHVSRVCITFLCLIFLPCKTELITADGCWEN